VDVGKYATTLDKLPETGTPLDYLLKIHWQMGNHAYFFSTLARYVLNTLSKFEVRCSLSP
jgi:hypothetical protein